MKAEVADGDNPVKIEIDLPDWCEERHIYVFAGIELAAYKYAGESWKIKTGRCHQCGGCCIFEDGPCHHLIPDGPKRVCHLGSARPFSCGAGVGLKNIEGCTETFGE